MSAHASAVAVVESLRGSELTIGTAESLTAGRVASTLAEVPGVSEWLRGGVVAYAYEVKSALLGVDAAELARTGAVTEDVARQMALGAVAALDADVVVATTGVAGPGPSEGQPAGTVWLAAAVRDGGILTRMLRLPGDREQVRETATREALELLREVVEQIRGRTR